jgi:hypothetical protein
MSSDAGLYFWRSDDDLFLFVSGRVTATEAYSLYRHVEGWVSEHPRGSIYVDSIGQTTSTVQRSVR